MLFEAVAWSQAMVEGYALAAALCRDKKTLAAAADGLSPDVTAQVEAVQAALSGDNKVAALRALSERMRPEVEGATSLSPRMKALVASRAARDVGRAWLAASPLRAQFRPDRGLVRTLLRFARTNSIDGIICRE